MYNSKQNIENFHLFMIHTLNIQQYDVKYYMVKNDKIKRHDL